MFCQARGFCFHSCSKGRDAGPWASPQALPDTSPPTHVFTVFTPKSENRLTMAIHF
jgi:hypothetical protein